MLCPLLLQLSLPTSVHGLIQGCDLVVEGRLILTSKETLACQGRSSVDQTNQHNLHNRTVPSWRTLWIKPPDDTRNDCCFISFIGQFTLPCHLLVRSRDRHCPWVEWTFPSRALPFLWLRQTRWSVPRLLLSSAIFDLVIGESKEVSSNTLFLYWPQSQRCPRRRRTSANLFGL